MYGLAMHGTDLGSVHIEDTQDTNIQEKFPSHAFLIGPPISGLQHRDILRPLRSLHPQCVKPLNLNLKRSISSAGS